MPMIVVALVSGVIFGAGLTISGMVDPAKILNFLDFASIATGTWDPTLAVVFAAAVAAMAVGVLAQRSMLKPLIGELFVLPKSEALDRRLIGGAALFGIGWGIAGLCPGPAIAGLAIAGSQFAAVAVFVAALICGVLLSRLVNKA